MFLYSMCSEKDLGLYSSVLRIVENLHFIPIIFMATLFPLLSSTFGQSKDKFKHIYTKVFGYMSMFIIPVAVGTTFLSSKIVVLLYGQSFIAASSAMAILMWAEVFVFLGTVNGEAITASGAQKYIFYFTLIGASLSLLFNYLLIPKYGINGAAVSLVISYSGGPAMILQYLLPKTRDLTKAYFASIFKPILCSLPMALFLFVFIDINLFVLIGISIVLYFLALCFSKSFGKQEIHYIKQAFSFRESSNRTE